MRTTVLVVLFVVFVVAVVCGRNTDVNFYFADMVRGVNGSSGGGTDPASLDYSSPCNILGDCNNGAAPYITTNFGQIAPDDQNSLKAGPRGPVLLEDFNLREKITHFDHERIPERVVHARGTGAHGYFQLYESQSNFTRATFLNDASKPIPVFARFSTVAGSRGSADTPRDVRGFAVRFYTSQGNYDLVGNNIPIFFIQDAIKFPDLIHAVKPEPNNEIPQAASAHDNFWDWASLSPESTAMLMWIMSDRTLPRQLSTMEGFGVHTFKLVNEAQQVVLVKFHWKPVLGVHSTIWDETQKIAGKDSDFHRRSIYNAIEKGQYPEWELGLQVMSVDDQLRFGFDLLDATKFVPEELVPVRIIGKMVLNRNPDNYFQETEQVAFHPAHIVSGIDFSDDPLLQGRLFSYIDTQINRFSSANYLQLPINKPHVPVVNNYQDGFMRFQSNKGRVNYEPNSFNAKGCPFSASYNQGAYVTNPQQLPSVTKTRAKSTTFLDYFTQASLFYNSLSSAEKSHLTDAFIFELSKVETAAIRQRMVNNLNKVNFDLATKVAMEVGVTPPSAPLARYNTATSPAVSEANTIFSAKYLTVAILLVEGFSNDQLSTITTALNANQVNFDLISTRLGNVVGSNGVAVAVDKTTKNSVSVFYDGVVVPNVAANGTNLTSVGAIKFFIAETFKHCKPIGLVGRAIDLLSANGIAVQTSNGAGVQEDLGVVTLRSSTAVGEFADRFISNLALQRFFDRQNLSYYDSISV